MPLQNPVPKCEAVNHDQIWCGAAWPSGMYHNEAGRNARKFKWCEPCRRHWEEN